MKTHWIEYILFVIFVIACILLFLFPDLREVILGNINGI